MSTIPEPTAADMRADLLKHYCWETYTGVDGKEHEDIYHALSNAAIRIAEHYRQRLVAIGAILTDEMLEGMYRLSKPRKLSLTELNQLRELLRGKGTG